MEENPIQVKEDANAVPWTIMDTWLGVGLLILLSAGMLVVVFLNMDKQALQGAGILLFELVYILPVALIFAWRGISWKHLGFRKFLPGALFLGFGLLILSYTIILPHNYLLEKLGMDTQGDQIFELFKQLKSPIWFMLAGAVVAPLVEEIFFRGFLFQGFRQKYGWGVAIILSSLIFAAAHLDPISFIPTFVLGCALAILFHTSNSVLPGVLLHAFINSFSLFMIYVLTKYPHLISS